MLARRCLAPVARGVWTNIGPKASRCAVLYRSSSTSNDELTSNLYAELARIRGNQDLRLAKELVTELVKQRHELPNVALYQALVQANCDLEFGSAAELDLLFQEMRQEDIDPDQTMYRNALKVLAIHPDALLREQILQEMRESWISPDDITMSSVLIGLLKDGQLENALEQVQDLERKGKLIHSWVYDMATYMLCEMEEIEEAANIVKQRTMKGDTNIHQVAWFRLFDAACDKLHHETINFIWFRAVQNRYFNPTSGQCLAALSSASRTGHIKLATEVFRILSQRRTLFKSYHYELLMNAHIKSKDIKTPLTILCIMAKAGIRVDKASTAPIKTAIMSSSEAIEETYSQLRNLEQSGRVVPTAAMNCVIEASLKTHDLFKSIDYYKSLHKICAAGPNTETFNILLRGCRDNNGKKAAMFLVSEMIALGIKPTSNTYESLIFVCLNDQADNGYEDAFKYLGEMRASGFKPRFETMKLMVEKLCSSNDSRCLNLLDDMQSMSMPIKELQSWINQKQKEMHDLSG